MEAAIEQCYVDKKYFDIQKKELFLDNDRLLEHIIYIVHICVNSLATLTDYAKVEQDYIDAYSENLVLKAELANKKENMVEKKVFNEVAKDVSIANLRKHIESLKGKNMVEKDATPNNAKELVEHARALRPLDSDLDSAYSHKTQDSNKPALPSIGIKSSTSVSRSLPSGNTKNNRISQTTSRNLKNKVEDHPKRVKSNSNKTNRVIKLVCNAKIKHSMLNTNSELICATCNECMFDAIHDLCVLDFVNDVNVRSKSKSAKSSKEKKTWKPTSKIFNNVGYRWLPIGRTFTIVGKKCLVTRITSTKVVHPKETSKTPITIPNPEVKIYRRRTKVAKLVVQIVLWYLDSRCSKNVTGNRSQLIDFVYKFLGIVRFGNNQIAKIMGYGDYQMGNITISWVYYLEGLGHNLFFVGQFCDSDLEVAFRKHTCYICNLEGVDLLKGSRGSNLYTLSLEDMMLSSPICLLSKASKTKSWLRHQKLSHLNFDYITTLANQGLFTWVKFLRSKDEVLESVIKFLKMIQVHLNAIVQNIKIDNGTKFVNQTLRAYYEDIEISHQTSVACTLQQNDIVKRRNQTLVEAARTMLIFSKALLSLWA
ncbi:retrovirus-related pol polyprotein from transposon TNT 1-94 [Tanacetum coccineum]|uniref:Retrovirus-related pol polyprotein from transposon TNT 1-94 n=1 Tax=Tanacetum coccineum TaxID=301880 RepID=A0ABQ5E0W4_9ASTR